MAGSAGRGHSAAWKACSVWQPPRMPAYLDAGGNAQCSMFAQAPARIIDGPQCAQTQHAAPSQLHPSSCPTGPGTSNLLGWLAACSVMHWLMPHSAVHICSGPELQ